MVKVAAASLVIFTQVHASVVAIDPKGTYREASDDPEATDSVAIELASVGIEGGDLVTLRALGDYAIGVDGEDSVNNMLGVFSSSDRLLGPSERYRLPDAIDVSQDVDGRSIDLATPNDADIVEDFSIAPFPPYNLEEVTIRVPEQALYLFVSSADSFFSDNMDPDGDFALDIRVVPIPGALVLFGTGLWLLLPSVFSRRNAAGLPIRG